MKKIIDEKVKLHRKLSKELETYIENYRKEPGWEGEGEKKMMDYKWDTIKKLNELYVSMNWKEKNETLGINFYKSDEV